MTDTRITYDDAEPGTEAYEAFSAAIEAGAMSLSGSARNYVGNYVFVGDDAAPKHGRPARNFLFEHEDGAALLRFGIPEAEEEPVDEDRELPPSYINGGHIRALQAVLQHPGTTLTSVRVDGEPNVAIVIVEPVKTALRVHPLFIGINPKMEVEYLEFDFHESGGKSRQGRAKPKRPFDAVAEVTGRTPKAV